MTSITSDPHAILRHCHAAAIAAVQPEIAMREPLAACDPGRRAIWIVSVGKASHGMASALVRWLSDHGREPAGGIIVGAGSISSPHPSLITIVGDHPIPQSASAAAANAIAQVIELMPGDADVHVALSGGASALIAGPLPRLTEADVTRTFELLISSGLDIGEMNAVRKRVTRWSAGRLAIALAPRATHVWAISDVIGDDPGDIASGPCTRDSWTSDAVRGLLATHGLLARLPIAVQRAMTEETPTSALATVTMRIVASNRMACDAALRYARTLGLAAQAMPSVMRGDAHAMGREIAQVMQVGGEPRIRIWGGETTVSIEGEAGPGGRCQALALAAAESMRNGSGVLLAAGTDGRDGPTDAAGAMVDGSTWQRIIAAGRDPATDLRHHHSYAALDSAGALIKTGLTGTNVMDLALTATGWR